MRQVGIGGLPATPISALAFGYVAFARDERNLFRFLFLEASSASGGTMETRTLDTVSEELGPDIFAGTVLGDLPLESQEALVEHTWIFTHGLAMMVNAGGGGRFDDDRIRALLMSAGQAFYFLEHHKAPTTTSEDSED